MAPFRESWKSRYGFIMAAAGSAIGLGAIWEFPYMTGTAGGGAFFLIFLIFTFLIGLPILLAEYFIGRGSQKDAVSAFKFFAPGTSWHWVGKWGIVGSIILLSFYSVVGGWILIYIVRALTGELSHVDSNSYGELFSHISAHSLLVLIGQAVFLLVTVLIVARGVQRGIEKASKIMMPALFIFFLILVIRSLTLEHAGRGVSFFLTPDFTHLNAQSILTALGQSFFLLSVGFSNMITYSSYVSKQESLVKSATTVVCMNIVVALLAGLTIFPALFSFGVKPEAGPGLLFVVLPAVFHEIPGGIVFFVIFLFLFLFAALTSAFPLLEVVVAALTKEDQSKRRTWAWVIGFIIFIVGIPSALSFGVLSDIHIAGQTVFDLANYLVSNILLPLGALFIALFIHFQIPRKTLVHEFTTGLTNGKRLFVIWLFIIKYVAPIAIIIAFLNVAGVLHLVGL